MGLDGLWLMYVVAAQRVSDDPTVRRSWRIASLRASQARSSDPVAELRRPATGSSPAMARAYGVGVCGWLEPIGHIVEDSFAPDEAERSDHGVVPPGRRNPLGQAGLRLT